MNGTRKQIQNTAEARYLIESGKTVEAVAQLSEWLARYPKRHEWYSLRARAYLFSATKTNATERSEPGH
jgi:predicted Zn-dependent protease